MPQEVEKVKIELPPGMTAEDLRKLFIEFKVGEEASKILRKNPQYRKLLKSHREAVARRKASIDEASLLWSRISNLRYIARTKAREKLEKEVPTHE